MALRYFNVFGPRQDPRSQYAAVIPNFIAALRAGRAPTIFGDGEQSRDFTFVADVVEANVRAVDAPGVSGHVVNVASGRRTTVNRLLAVLGELLETPVEPEHAPSRPGEVLHSLADIELGPSDAGMGAAGGPAHRAGADHRAPRRRGARLAGAGPHSLTWPAPVAACLAAAWPAPVQDCRPPPKCRLLSVPIKRSARIARRQCRYSVG